MKTLVSPTHAEKLPAGPLPAVRVDGLTLAGILPLSAAASCPGVVAHIVKEQVMAKHTKSKMAANLLRLGFIDFSLAFGFLVSTSVRRLFLAAAQMCFCWVKRNLRLKPAKFFVAAMKQRI